MLKPPRPSMTKIVATVGPASADVGRLVELIEAGVDVFRVNMAHGDRQEHQRRIEAVREAARGAGEVVGLLVDLAGPKIRLGELPGGEVECVRGSRIRLVRGAGRGRPGELTTSYESLVDELAVGDRVMLADGTVALRVEAIDGDGATCQVIQGGLLRSRQGVNLPGVRLSVSALGPKDRENAVWAAGAGVDFVGLSFVRTAEEVGQLQALLKSEGSSAQVVAKIEKPEALENLEAIVQAADAVMVARGDLGVEIDIAQVPVAQKRIIDTCRRHRKPVIIATQMLDSMQHARIPTRAEATDVANAILDGADACMLSGETAIGQYPVEAVATMHRIALAAENLPRRLDAGVDRPGAIEGLSQVTEATARAAGRLAETLGAKALVVVTSSGRTALGVSKNRHRVPTFGVSPSEAILRRMCLYWGVIPLAGAPAEPRDRLIEYVVQKGLATGSLTAGDRIVLLTSSGPSPAARHNAVLVHEIQ